jgi:hypothetical protein
VHVGIVRTVERTSHHRTVAPSDAPSHRRTLAPSHLFVFAVLAGAAALAARQASPTPYEELLSILERRPANIEQVLQALPEELRSNFTFVHASRSPHRDEIDRQFPRVVLFSEDARLLLAFTGNPRGAAYNQLEAIHYDERTSAFRTSRFILDDAVRRNPGLKAAAATNGALDRFECTRCHGADARPIFDSYSVWPGFYGSTADRMLLDSSEKRDYVRFLAGNAREGVYRHLRFPSGSSVAPYDDGATGLSGAETLRFHPNERLGQALTPLNWQRIVRKLSARGDVYRRLRYPLLSGLLGCQPLPISDAFTASIKAELERENARRFERAGLKPGDETYNFRMQELVRDVPYFVAEVAYVASALGVSRADWSMSFEPSSLGFFDGVLTRPVLYIKQDLIAAMLRALAAEDRELAPFYQPSYVFEPAGYKLGLKLPMDEIYGDPAFCSLLEDRSRKASAPPLPAR